MAAVHTFWLHEALRVSVSGVYTPGPHASEIGAERELVPDDPGKDPGFKKLAESVLAGRELVATYNLVLLGALLVFTTWHWASKIAIHSAGHAHKKTKDGPTPSEACSSSSSTVGCNSPLLREGSLDSDDLDEMSPLMPSRAHRRGAIDIWKPYYLSKAYLQYQPRAIPLINRNLPTNAVSLLVLVYLGLNLFYNFYGMTYELMYIFSFADRCGLIFSANLPLLYLLAAKNQPLKFLTGYSYESLNILHRRVGELLCFEAFLHLVGMFLVWYGVLRKVGFTFARFILNKLVVLGLLAFVSYQILYFTSLAGFRQRMYEVFLVLHILFQIVGLVFLWFHFHTSRPYVGAAIAIFVIDRLVFRLWLKSTTHTATLTILEDNETVLVSSNWDVSSKTWALVRYSAKHGWRTNDHVFLTVPALSRKQAFQAHPFTIFTAAPRAGTNEEGAHAWLSLLVRAQGDKNSLGFTRQLLAYARTHSRVDICLDGPYGSNHAISMLHATDNAIIVAGGSGIAVAYPLLYALLERRSRDIESGAKERVGRKTRLVWIVHDAAHFSWIPVDRWKELLSWGLEAHMPLPTSLAGRPDVPSILHNLVGRGRTGVVVSGPAELTRVVRNTCAKLIGGGADVSVQVEKFGW